MPGCPKSQTALRLIAQITDCDTSHIFDLLRWYDIIDIIVINDISMARDKAERGGGLATSGTSQLNYMSQSCCTLMWYDYEHKFDTVRVPANPQNERSCLPAMYWEPRRPLGVERWSDWMM